MSLIRESSDSETDTDDELRTLWASGELRAPIYNTSWMSSSRHPPVREDVPVYRTSESSSSRPYPERKRRGSIEEPQPSHKRAAVSGVDSLSRAAAIFRAAPTGDATFRIAPPDALGVAAGIARAAQNRPPSGTAQLLEAAAFMSRQREAQEREQAQIMQRRRVASPSRAHAGDDAHGLGVALARARAARERREDHRPASPVGRGYYKPNVPREISKPVDPNDPDEFSRLAMTGFDLGPQAAQILNHWATVGSYLPSLSVQELAFAYRAYYTRRATRRDPPAAYVKRILTNFKNLDPVSKDRELRTAAEKAIQNRSV